MVTLYGHGYNRILKPGEEATIIENIYKIVNQLYDDPDALLVGISSNILITN